MSFIFLFIYKSKWEKIEMVYNFNYLIIYVDKYIIYVCDLKNLRIK